MKLDDSFLDGISDLCHDAMLVINEAKIKNILEFFSHRDWSDKPLTVIWCPDAAVMLINDFAVPLLPDTFIMAVEGTAGECHIKDWVNYTSLQVEYVPKTTLRVRRCWMEGDECCKGEIVISHTLLKK